MPAIFHGTVLIVDFLSTFFNTSENISVSENSFSYLEDVQSPGVPNASFSPIHRPREENQSNKTKCINQPLKILTINVRSIKKTDLDVLLDSLQPDIIIGTET